MTTGPLDPRLDPDRYRPEEPDPPPVVPEAGDGTSPLDPADDPDRFVPDLPSDAPPPLSGQGQGQSLTDLLGSSRTYEGERDNYQWALGLLAVLAFLGLVAFLFGSVLTPSS